MAGVSLSARFTAASLQAISRFGKTPIQAAADKALLQLGRDAKRSLEDATPVRTGRMRSSYSADYQPSVRRLTLSNSAPYAGIIAYGTARRPPNATLKRAIDTLPDQASVALGQIGSDVMKGLTNG